MPENDAAAKVTFPWWLTVIVCIGAGLMAAGALIAMINPALLVDPHEQINGAVHVYAGYLTSRNLALAIMLFASLAMRERRMLSTLTLLTALVQFLDAGIDCLEGRWPIVPGVILFGV